MGNRYASPIHLKSLPKKMKRRLINRSRGLGDPAGRQTSGLSERADVGDHVLDLVGLHAGAVLRHFALALLDDAGKFLVAHFLRVRIGKAAHLHGFAGRSLSLAVRPVARSAFLLVGGSRFVVGPGGRREHPHCRQHARSESDTHGPIEFHFLLLSLVQQNQAIASPGALGRIWYPNAESRAAKIKWNAPRLID